MASMIFQNSYFDCSRACALMVRPDLDPPKPNSNGLTPETFVRWAEGHGVLVSAGHLESDAPLAPGDIVLVDLGFVTHYVVVTRINRSYVYVKDPNSGPRRYTKKSFREAWYRKWSIRLRPAPTKPTGTTCKSGAILSGN